MKRNYFFVFLVSLSFCVNLHSQQQYIQLVTDENQNLHQLPFSSNLIKLRSLPPSKQIEGFPKKFIPNDQTKNFRNVTLADVNGDGCDDAIFGTNETIIAVSKDSIIWSRKLSGVITYPPASGDVNNDGELDFVVTTGGGSGGRVYVLDKEGNNFQKWPLNFDNNRILTSSTLSDLDNDGELEIIFIERDPPGGRIHIFSWDRTPFNEFWPQRLPGTPAVTPTIADLDNDGVKEIVVHSTTVMYAFNLSGQLLEGWPIENEDTKFSFQSPIAADLDGDGDLEIIGSSHGNDPEYYAVHHNGSYVSGWPKKVPNKSWTFSPPTLFQDNGNINIIMSKPIINIEDEMLYCWDQTAVLKKPYPLIKIGGAEGYSTIADLNNDNILDIIIPSNIIDEEGFGSIHAYSSSDLSEISGFPKRTIGWTYMNGASLTDFNCDGKVDLVALSYSIIEGNNNDSLYLNVFELEDSVQSQSIHWNTYKGSNSRDGDFSHLQISTSTDRPNIENLYEINIFPNPFSDKIEVNLEKDLEVKIELYNLSGICIKNEISIGSTQINTNGFSPGMYILKVISQGKSKSVKVIKI